MKIPKVGDEIWLPGGKGKILEVRRKIESIVEINLSDNREIMNYKKVSHSVLVKTSRDITCTWWFEWEDNIGKFQKYFEEHSKRRDCRICQFLLPWNTCEIHG